jgi:hypothetical protein
MAHIIGGIGTSHVPTIAMAYDKKKGDEPAWKPLFDGYVPVREWLAREKPDVLVVFYNDHANSFFFDLYPTFAIGVDERYALADEGAGPRALPPFTGHAPLAIHLAEQLVAEEFDMTVFRDRALDHGFHSPLPYVLPHEPDWPCAVVPIAINVLQYPLPTARRCYRLGEAVARAIASFPEDLKVAIVGTGGLSHQIHGERAGFNSEPWDREFLRLLETEPQALTQLTHKDYVERGGAEGAEVIMWLAMRGALGVAAPAIRCLHQNYYLATSTAMAVALYEPVGGQS